MAKRIPTENAATADEVNAAIEALPKADLSRLKQYAEFRVQPMRLHNPTYTADDLLQEAIVRTLDDRRRWNPKAVDFARHLHETIHSISSHAAGKAKDGLIVPATALTRESLEGEQHPNPYDQAESPLPDPEHILTTKQTNDSAKEAIERIERVLDGDEVALLLIEGMREEMNGPEIRDALGLSQKEYETAMRRLRRTVRKAFPEGRSNA